jgi:hypothetical protein
MRRDREIPIQIIQKKIEYFCDRCGILLTEEESPHFGTPRNTIQKREIDTNTFEDVIVSYDLCDKCWGYIVEEFEHKR